MDGTWAASSDIQNLMDGTPRKPSALQNFMDGTMRAFLVVQNFMDGTAGKPKLERNVMDGTTRGSLTEQNFMDGTVPPLRRQRFFQRSPPISCHSMKNSSKRKHNSVPSMTFCSTTQRSGPPVHDVLFAGQRSDRPVHEVLTRCGASNQCATETPSAVGLGIGFIGGGGQAISPMSVWGGRAAGYNQPRSNGNRSRKDTA